MNIFCVDIDPYIAATMLCDKHVCKMYIESCQLLTSIFPVSPYKKTHLNHPITKWVRKSRDNFNWLLTHCKGLHDEYHKRYPDKIHKCDAVFTWICNSLNLVDLPLIGLTPHHLGMPDQYKTKNVVESYRNYYIYEKTFAKWKLGNIPDWYLLSKSSSV